MPGPFDPYLALWNLVPDGAPLATPAAELLPVRRTPDNVPAMLKIATAPEEQFGGALMVWWNGDGAAPVLAHDSHALLLLRAEGERSLTALARSGPGGDDAATRILCQAAARLHAPRDRPTLAAVPLAVWFRDLFPTAERHGGIFTRCAQAAEELLSSPQDDTLLHGDLHHANVLDFGPKGWLAIDPKRLRGERGFEYACLFRNPDRETALLPGRLARQVTVVCETANLERRRLLQWILAGAGLSAAWTLGDGGKAELALTVAELAAAALER